jgi:hypothetical protein
MQSCSFSAGIDTFCAAFEAQHIRSLKFAHY